MNYGMIAVSRRFSDREDSDCSDRSVDNKIWTGARPWCPYRNFLAPFSRKWLADEDVHS